MNKIAIVYHSKYGSTKNYAEMIAHEVGADLFTDDKCKISMLESYDTIVYGGAIHAGGIMGLNFIKKNFDKLSGKRIITFAVGLNVDDPENQQQCREINFVKKLEGLPCFFMRGAYDPYGVSKIDKKLLDMIGKMVEKTPANERTSDQNELITAVRQGANFVDKKYIEGIVEELKSL